MKRRLEVIDQFVWTRESKDRLMDGRLFFDGQRVFRRADQGEETQQKSEHLKERERVNEMVDQSIPFNFPDGSDRESLSSTINCLSPLE